MMSAPPRHMSDDASVTAASRAGGTDRLDWDDLRVPDVAGRDRQLIPDEVAMKCCIAGTPADCIAKGKELQAAGVQARALIADQLKAKPAYVARLQAQAAAQYQPA